MPRGKRRPGTTASGGKSPAAKQRKGNKTSGNASGGQTDSRGAINLPNTASRKAPTSPGEQIRADITPSINQTDTVQESAPIVLTCACGGIDIDSRLRSKSGWDNESIIQGVSSQSETALIFSGF